MRKVVCLAGLLALAACNTPYDNALPPGSLAGGWSGSLSSAGTSQGTVRLSLVPGPDIPAPTPGGVAGWTMTGTWSIALPAGADSGSVSGRGTDAGTIMHFTLQGTSGCSIELSGTLIGGAAVRGPYVASSCALPDTGNFTISKQ